MWSSSLSVASFQTLPLLRHLDLVLLGEVLGRFLAAVQRLRDLLEALPLGGKAAHEELYELFG